MEHDELSRHLLLTTEIALCNEQYGKEAMREYPARGYMEAWASRLLKRAAELYALASPGPVVPQETGDKDQRAVYIIDFWDGRKY